MLTDAVRFRDFVEWVGSLDRKPKAPGCDERSYFPERVKGMALKAAAEAHTMLFRAVEVGEGHHICAPPARSINSASTSASGDVERGIEAIGREKRGLVRTCLRRRSRALRRAGEGSRGWRRWRCR